MSALVQDILGYLVADTTGVYSYTSNRVCQNHVPEIYGRENYIWLGRSSETAVMAMDGPTGLRDASVDLECVSTTLSTAESMAEAVRTRLDGARTSTGTDTIAWIEVEDHSDDYLPKGIGEDDGLHVAALSVSVLYYPS